MRFFPTITATKTQTAAYLFGVALFSISFLVFLNASISFVVTDVIGRKERVCDAVGTLGFADELLALVACPLWGLLSDRIGVRNVVVMGYTIIALSFFLLVQSQNVYPQLLLGRLFFSIGGAACSTMVTATLPALTMKKPDPESSNPIAETNAEARAPPTDASNNVRHSGSFSISSQLTITPARYSSVSPRPALNRRKSSAVTASPSDPTDDNSTASGASSQLAGYVGMFTGVGALLAVSMFLPLPAAFGGNNGVSKKDAVKDSFYVVGCVALVVAVSVFFGLRGIPGDESKGFRNLLSYTSGSSKNGHGTTPDVEAPPYLHLVKEAVVLAFTDNRIALAYIGGFVARASSVAISLFIPLFVNAYFIRIGLCTEEPGEDLKNQCKRAYTLASMLSGFAELAALLCAPIFGWFNSRMSNKGALSNLPLGIGAATGILGSVTFAFVKNPDPFSDGPGTWVILSVILLGTSQIAAIVCSLGLLSRAIQGTASPPNAQNLESSATSGENPNNAIYEAAETAPLIASSERNGSTTSSTRDRTHLKGTIAGMYSLLLSLIHI